MYKIPLPPNTPVKIENIGEIPKQLDFVETAKRVRQVTLEVFAEDESASVQATMYNTAQKVLAVSQVVKEISYSYPNKHYM
jgi:urate oxidase